MAYRGDPMVEYLKLEGTKSRERNGIGLMASQAKLPSGLVTYHNLIHSFQMKGQDLFNSLPVE